MSTEIAVPPKQPGLVKAESEGLMRLIEQVALNPELDAAKLEQLWKLKKEFDADIARKAFYAAKKEFREKAPPVPRTKRVHYKSKSKPDAPATDYWHVEIDKALELLGPVLHQVGLTWRWTSSVLQDGRTSVTCILSHELGFEDPTPPTLAAMPDLSGNKDQIKGTGSAVTYLERYTFLMACGVAASRQDDEKPPAEEAMEEAQIKDWEKKIRDSRDVPELKENCLAAQKLVSPDSDAAKRFDEAKRECWNQLKGAGLA